MSAAADAAPADAPRTHPRGAPRIAVFDLGGVVVRICRSWQEGCAAAGVAHRPAGDAHLQTQEFHALLDQHQRGHLESAAFHAALSTLMRGTYSAAEFGAIHAAWTHDEYPGITDAVNRIHSAGIDTGCLSNTNASHWEQLRSSPALARIRHRHASHLLGLTKPDAAIYRAFERASGYAPADIMFFDDLRENVAAAAGCGWNAVHIDHSGDTAKQVLLALEQAGIRA